MPKSDKNFLETRDRVARLLASESITVEYHAGISTAGFDTKNRILMLPIWTDVSYELCDFLTAHEVSHALFTPPKGWDEVIKRTKESDPFWSATVNIIEDCRIDKLIQRKYQGLKYDYRKGTQELFERDFFQLEERKKDPDFDINESSTADKLNMAWKANVLPAKENIKIELTPEEEKFLKRCHELETWEEVIDLANEIYDHMKEDDQLQDEQEVQMDLSQMLSAEGDGDGSEETESDDADGDDEEGNGYSLPDQNSRGADDIFKKKEETKIKVQKYKPGWTVDDYQKNLSGLIDTSRRQHIYADIPEYKYDSIITSVDKLITKLKKQTFEDSPSREDYEQFVKETKSVITWMVSEFNRKKSATKWLNRRKTPIGALNMQKLHSYKISEEIFDSTVRFKKGKNHGLIMYIDFSSSMSSNMHNTIEQLYNLVLFCRMAGIKHKVYGFSDCGYYYDDTKRYKKTKNMKTYVVPEQTFRLVELYNTNMDLKEFNLMSQFLWSWSNYDYGYSGGLNFSASNIDSMFNYSATPLNSCILAGIDISNKFKADENIEVLNTIFLTDGESNNLGFAGKYKNKCYYPDDPMGVYIRDQKTKKNYVIEQVGYRKNDTETVLKVYKDRVPGHIVNFFLGNLNEYASPTDKANGFGVQNSYQGYDLYITISPFITEIRNVAEILHGDNSKLEVGDLFKEAVKDRKKSRIFLTKFLDMIA